MKILGITGTSGVGKTTLTSFFSEYKNIKIIDSDKTVKKMSMPGEKYLKAIENEFGKEILLSDGNLNRKMLATRIYNDKKAREKLNNLTFKYVVEKIVHTINDIKESNIDFVIIDAPLLFESGLDKLCDYIIALISDEDLKLERICTRDNIDKETAKSRLNIQQEDNFYTQKANYVIKNNRNTDLKKEAIKILDQIN